MSLVIEDYESLPVRQVKDIEDIEDIEEFNKRMESSCLGIELSMTQEDLKESSLKMARLKEQYQELYDCYKNIDIKNSEMVRELQITKYSLSCAEKRLIELEEENKRLKKYNRFDILDIDNVL